MNTSYFILASLFCALSIYSCKENPANQEETEISKTESIPGSRAEKPPGCKTLIDMDHLDSFEIIDTTGMDVNHALQNYAAPIHEDTAAIYLQNVSTINSCNLHQIHIKDIPQSGAGYKQVIFNLMEDISTKTPELTAAGMKITCWSDENEQWHAKSNCN